jgi:hypothetical protein
MKQSTMTLDPTTMVSARRFRFVNDDAGITGVVRKRFAQPRAVAVIEEIIDVDAVLSGTTTSEILDQMDVVLIPDRDAGRIAGRAETWLTGDAEDIQVTTVTGEVGKIRLCGSRAVIRAADDGAEDLLDAVVEFGFLNAELQRLESALLPIQTGAPGDVRFAYRIRQSDQHQWDRLGEVMEQLAQLRLSFARLEPLMGSPTPTLQVEGRRAMSGLLSRTRTLDRLEAFSDRLEACEDLYEGAIDRITDHRWYRKGNLLEIAIVVLLAAEALLLLVDHLRR